MRIVLLSLALLAMGCSAAPGLVAPASVPAQAPAAAPTSTATPGPDSIPSDAEIDAFLKGLRAGRESDSTAWDSVEDCVEAVTLHIPTSTLDQLSFKSMGLMGVSRLMVQRACERDVSLQQLPDNVRRVFESMQLAAEIAEAERTARYGE